MPRCSPGSILCSYLCSRPLAVGSCPCSTLGATVLQRPGNFLANRGRLSDASTTQEVWNPNTACLLASCSCVSLVGAFDGSSVDGVGGAGWWLGLSQIPASVEPVVLVDGHKHLPSATNNVAEFVGLLGLLNALQHLLLQFTRQTVPTGPPNKFGTLTAEAPNLRTFAF